MKVLVKDNMSKKVITVSWTSHLSEAYGKMKKANIRHLVAIDDLGYAKGIISDRDFQRAMFVGSNFEASENSGAMFNQTDTIRDFMSWPIESVDSGAELSKVAEGMITKKISAFLVKDKDDVVGIITYEDLLRVLTKILANQRTFKDRIEEIAYTTPIGSIVNKLNEIGV